jgi:hypothetical protein
MSEYENRKKAAAQIAAGLTLTGGAAATQHHIGNRVGVKSITSGAKEAYKEGKVQPKHLKFLGGWAGTRGVAAAGVPLAAVGMHNMAKKKKPRELDVRRDMVDPSVDRTLMRSQHSEDKMRRRANVVAGATGLAATGAGGAVGAVGARRLLRSKGSLAVGAGTALGSATGLALASAPTRKLTRRATEGKYDYSLDDPTNRVRPIIKMSSNDAAINELAHREQKQLIARKKKQSKYSLASAGLGATALALQSPRLAALAARKSPKLAKVKPIAAVARVAPTTTNMSNTVGVGSLGVGALGSLNFARINRSETKADERSARALRKDDKPLHYDHASRAEVAKALVPIRTVRLPVLRKSGIRMVRTATGTRPVAFRGSTR